MLQAWYMILAVLVLLHGIRQSSYSTAYCVASINTLSKSKLRNRPMNADYSIGAPSKIPQSFPHIRNLYEKVTFSWTKDLMKRGNVKALELRDIWLLPESNRMFNSSNEFERLFTAEKSQERDDAAAGVELVMGYWKSPVTRAIVHMYKGQLFITGMLKLVNTLVQFTPSLIVSRILKYIGQDHSKKTISTSYNLFITQILPNLSPEMTNILLQIIEILNNKGFQLALLLFISLSCKTIIENQYFDSVSRLSAEVRGTLSTAIYRKSLKLSPGSRANNTMGSIVNYMQLDTSRLESVVHSIHTVWDGALQIIGYTFLLVQFLGPSVFAGIAAMFVILPLNSYFLRRISSLREANLKVTDKRVKLTNELLQGIRAIKSYNWETPFNKQLQNIRENELKGLKSAASMRSLLVCALSTAPSIVAVCTLATYALLGNELGPTKVFTSLALFNQLRFPLIFYPMLLNTLAEGKVSLRRITRFLLSDEVQNYVRTAEEECEDEVLSRRRAKESIRVTNASFAWGSHCEVQTPATVALPALSTSSTVSSSRTDNNSTTNSADCSTASSANSSEIASERPANVSVAVNRDRLVDVDLTVRKGQLVAVIGPTGSGKTTLLNALMGELYKCSGDVLVKGSVAYIPQSAWIPNDSFQNVVLFGRPLEKARYHRILRMCGLEKDLQLLEAGDQTEIGERGTNLSGGQKQRISVARAVYENADIYLFDDPLSALDNTVGTKLFNNCIKRGLAGKTRILVTHQLGVLAAVDKIILMDQEGEGGACRILDQGTLRELMNRGHDLTKYVTEKSESTEESDSLNAQTGAVSVLNPKIPTGADSSQNATDSTEYDNTASELLCPCVVPPSGGLLDGLQDDSITSGVSSADEEGLQEERSEQQCESATEQAEPVVEVVNSADESSTPLKSDSSVSTKPAVHLTSSTSPSPSDPANPLATTTATTPTTITPPTTLAPPAKSPIKLIAREERMEGAVGTEIYRAYIRAANQPMLLALLVLSVLLSNASLVWQQWVVAAWTSDPGYIRRPLAVYLGGMMAMASLVGLFNYLRTYFGVLFGVEASRTIHRKMIDRVVHAPLSFFESTPIGRLVQRFSKDLDQIDQQLPGAIGQLISSSFSIVSSMTAIALVTPSFTAAMSVIFYAYFRVTRYYRNVARELKRVEALSRTPIYTHFSESLGGMPVIRTFKRQSMYLRGNEVRVDENISAYVTLKVVDRWLCTRLEMLGNIIVLFSAALAVLTKSKAGSAGLSLNNALGVTSLLNWAVRNAADTEALMTSVERVSHTINKTPQEPAHRVDSIPPGAFTSLQAPASAAEEVMMPSVEDTPVLPEDDHLSTTTTPATTTTTTLTSLALPSTDQALLESGWPFLGGITMKGVRMRYRSDLDEVLKGVDLDIRPGERLGIVGRTGSGKSTLFRALLRLTDCEVGTIAIDGVDTAKVGLTALRSSVSIIPQDPVLFSGSIRFNLDPFGVHSDSQLWAALRKANLDRTIVTLPGALRYEVAEDGGNFSLGQRQLLCLARALVRRSRILLLDEATSSVDFATDAAIQATIRREFGDGSTTVLTIAHRLDSVLDCDRILVMDAGRVAELDTPEQLLSDPGSIFSELVAAQHSEMVDMLEQEEYDE